MASLLALSRHQVTFVEITWLLGSSHGRVAMASGGSSQTPDEPAPAAATSMWQCGEYQWKVIPKAHVEDSWKSIRRWDPQAEAKVAHEFETVKNCVFFLSHLYKDDKLRSIALTQTCSYLSAWRCHVEDDAPFTDQPWISQFKRNSEQETMQEKLDTVCDWHHYNRTNLMAEMKDAVKFLDVLCVNTRDGPHAAVFQGALVCLKDTMIHLDYSIARRK